MAERSDIRVIDVAKALAFVGDLSMGQPTDHSLRTGWLAAQIAIKAGFGTYECSVVKHVSLLRWSGCTANSRGFSELVGDDVASREAMLARRSASPIAQAFAAGKGAAFVDLARLRCDVSSAIAEILSLGDEASSALRHVFESYDGTGPNNVAGDDIPQTVLAVTLAGDFEVLSRTYGVDAALEMIRRDAGSRYSESMVTYVVEHGHRWHSMLPSINLEENDDFWTCERTLKHTSTALIANVIDLKLPWMARNSSRVASAAQACAIKLGFDDEQVGYVYRAGLIHSIGRTAISNDVWNIPGKLTPSAWEAIRLAPYWTLRAGQSISALEREARIASFAFERMDGSGYFRGVAGPVIPREARVLAAAAAWVALRSPRPWRGALSDEEASKILWDEARAGRFDGEVVSALATGDANTTAHRESMIDVLLSPREMDVLQHVSRGASNKDVAKALGISPSTVGTHMENLFRKLGCSSRAAATLKASALGLLI